MDWRQVRLVVKEDTGVPATEEPNASLSAKAASYRGSDMLLIDAIAGLENSALPDGRPADS
jgi:hypothetical protein